MIFLDTVHWGGEAFIVGLGLDRAGSMFSTLRDAEGNIKRYRDSKMIQRWMATVLLYSEKGFRRIKGYASTPDVIRVIEATEENSTLVKKAA